MVQVDLTGGTEQLLQQETWRAQTLPRPKSDLRFELGFTD